MNKKNVDATQKDRPFDKVRLADLENHPFSLSQFKGKTIFLNFWATWCKPCIAEMASIEKARNILQKENVVFLVASGETAEEIMTFRNSHSYEFKYAQIQNAEELNIQSLPTTFIFNPEGKLVFSETGARKLDEKNNIDLIFKIGN